MNKIQKVLSFGYRLLGILSLFFILTGCHYQFGYGDLASHYSTITIPYIKGDQEGKLTAELIKKISTSGAFYYYPYGGELTLQVELIELRDENIGFSYDHNKRGELRRLVIPTETRLHAIVEVTLIETTTQKVIRGPIRITAHIDFDHDYYSSRHAINIFSLGQLSDIDAAHEAVMDSLSQQLAEKIANYIINSW